MMLATVIIAMLLAQPVEPDYGSGPFAQYCQAEVAKASCTCMIDRLTQTPDGRFALEAFSATLLPEDKRAQAMRDLLNRYNLRPSEAQSRLQQAMPSLKSAADGCS
jgi:hypothetical protein